MTVPEDFKVTLFAGEPDVCQPIALCTDDRGRLWVAEAYSYPIRRPEKEARDRILENRPFFRQEQTFIRHAYPRWTRWIYTPVQMLRWQVRRVRCRRHEPVGRLATRPVSRRLDDGFTLEFLLVCTSGIFNAFSFLYARCAKITRLMGFERVISPIPLLRERGLAAGGRGHADRPAGVERVGATRPNACPPS